MLMFKWMEEKADRPDITEALNTLVNQSIEAGRLQERNEVLTLIEMSIKQAQENKCGDTWAIGWVMAMNHLKEQITIGRKWLP